MKNIEIIINKSEITAGTRGASLGPEAIMTAARKANSQIFGEYTIEKIEDRNDLLDIPVKYQYAKRAEGLVEVYNTISSKIKEKLLSNIFPFVLGGDHGSAGGTIAGVKAAYPQKRLGVVWIDAHGDLHTPYTTPSGNMHGMPLATALGEDNLEVRRNNISEEAKLNWEKLKSTGVEGPKLMPEDLVFIAVRDTERQEDALMERLNIRNHTVGEIREKGKAEILRQIESQLADCDIIYVSFDVDSMDPQHTSHGTGTPVDNGLTSDEAEFFLTELAKNKKLVCIEFVEVNPCLDEKKNKMAEVTFDLFQKTIKELSK